MTLESQPIKKEEIDFLKNIMNKKYAAQIKDRRFEISTKADSLGIHAEVVLQNETGSFYYPVEGRIYAGDHKMEIHEAALFLVEYIDSYFEEFLQDEVNLPIDWSSYYCEGVRIELRGQVVNRKLETMADEWLSQHN